MRLPHGYATWTYPEKVVKCDTRTCFHCNHADHIWPMQRPEDIGGLCRMCMQLICANCVGKPCDPFEEKWKRMEASYHARRYMFECTGA